MNIVYANIVHGNVDFFVCRRKSPITRTFWDISLLRVNLIFAWLDQKSRSLLMQRLRPNQVK